MKSPRSIWCISNQESDRRGLAPFCDRKAILVRPGRFNHQSGLCGRTRSKADGVFGCQARSRFVTRGVWPGSVRSPGTASGRKHALTTGRFQAAKFHWPLSSDAFDERTDEVRPTIAFRPMRGLWPVANWNGHLRSVSAGNRGPGGHSRAGVH